MNAIRPFGGPAAVLDGTDDGIARLVFVRMGLHRRRDGDDALQEARLALLIAARRFDPAKGGSWAWYAMTGVRRALLAWVRAEKRAARVGALTDADAAELVGGPLPDPPAGAWETVDRLPPRQALAVRLRFAEGLHYADVGARMGVSGERARQVVREALAELRRGPTRNV